MKLFCCTTIIGLSSLCSLPALALSEPASLTVTCPEPAAIRFTPSGYPESWRAIDDSADAPIDYVNGGQSPLGNSLSLTGQGSSTSAQYWKSANWLYGSLNCFYQGDKDVIVLINNELNNYTTDCHFASGNTSECQSSDPQQCVLSCHLQNLRIH